MASQPVLADVGVLGGISLVVCNAEWRCRHAESLQNHPITDAVCFCVHPCNTAQALKDVIGIRSINLTEYFQIWFGLIASSVGLFLPKEMVITKGTKVN